MGEDNSVSDVLDNSGKSEGKRSHRTRDYPPGLGEYWTSIKPGAQKRTRTRRRRVNTDTWTRDKGARWLGTATHRLRTLGIASPFDLPKDPYHLLELIAIVLCRRIHFLSVKTSHYFSSNIGTPEFNPQGTQDNRQFEQISNNWRAGFLESQPQLHHPLIAHLEGRPRTCTSSIFEESLLGRSASTNRTG